MSAIVALAGHVDHGKSALVTALTDVATDRLDQEAASRHTIEVFPAHLPATGATLLDVPGHVDWVTAAMAGFGAATHVLCVVAADDGPMPQTHEHLDAVHALGLPVLAVAITRADLVDRAASEAVVRAVHDLVDGPSGGTVPVVTTSTVDGRGLGQLRELIVGAHAPRAVPPLPGPDMWVDRGFVVPGRGTVVVGTLRRGRVTTGDHLVVAPDASAVRVRGIQHRNDDVDNVAATGRVALRVDAERVVTRGDRLLARDLHRDGVLGSTFTAWVTNSSDRPLGHRGAWTLHVGTAVVAARLRPRPSIEPGRDGPATVVSDQPVPIRPGDRFVLRDTGRRRVVGGGIALVSGPGRPSPRSGGDRRPAGHDDRPSPAVLRDLATAFAQGDRAAVRAGLVAAHGGILDRAHLVTVVATDQSTGTELGPARREAVVAAVDALLVAGTTRDLAEVVSRVSDALGLPPWAVREVIDNAGYVRSGTHLHQLGPGTGDGADHSVSDRHDDRTARLAAARAEVEAAGLAPPRMGELAARHGLATHDLHEPIRSGQLHQAGPYLFAPTAVETALGRLATLPTPFTVAAARDALGITRRHTVPLLESLDRDGVLRRDDRDRRTVIDPVRRSGRHAR